MNGPEAKGLVINGAFPKSRRVEVCIDVHYSLPGVCLRKSAKLPEDEQMAKRATEAIWNASKCCLPHANVDSNLLCCECIGICAIIVR